MQFIVGEKNFLVEKEDILEITSINGGEVVIPTNYK